MLTQGGNGLSFQKGHLAYFNAKLLTEMHMELSGIRRRTKVWFGLQCKVVCVSGIQFCTIVKLAKHREVPRSRAVESTSNLQTGKWILQPSRRIEWLTQINFKLLLGGASPCARRVWSLDTWARNVREKWQRGTTQGSDTRLMKERRVQEQMANSRARRVCRKTTENAKIWLIVLW